MGERSRGEWALFFGGVVVGGAAAAGAAYAISKHYLKSQDTANFADFRSRKQSASRPSTPRRNDSPSVLPPRSQSPPRTAYNHLAEPRSRSVSVAGRSPAPLRHSSLGTHHVTTHHLSNGRPASPRVEWLAREDMAEDEPGGPRFLPESLQSLMGKYPAANDVRSTVNLLSGEPSQRSTMNGTHDAHSRGPSTTLDKEHINIPADTMFLLPPADRANVVAMDVLKNPGAHVPRSTPIHANGTAHGAQTKLADTGKAIEQAATHCEDYCRVVTPETAPTEESEEVCAMLMECLEMRKRWLFQPAVGPEQRKVGMLDEDRFGARLRRVQHEPEAASPSEVNPRPLEYRPCPSTTEEFEVVEGVVHVYSGADSRDNMFPVPGNATEFFTDMHRILRYSSAGPVKSFCHHRLVLLEQKFNLHIMLNSDKEFLAQKSAPHRDFYNVRKVDTHIHHSACMHQKHLLRFIKSKLRKEPDEVVIFRDGKYLTLREVFESLQLTGYDLNVDTLDMHVDKNIFHRFDKFNLKYNPCGQSRLREIFIKQDNLIHGRFLAELTQEVLSDYDASKYQHAELRISIYGRKQVEWDILASWVVGNNLYSDNVVWLIQIPRLYNVYREQGIIENFQQMLDNIFVPLFEVTRDPASHPQLHVFLSQVVGFDMVDDESKPERRPTKHSPPPTEWTTKHNAAYSYYAYYVYANLYVLNKYREAKGLNTFSFRPHAGEAGDIDHLVGAFLLCENIAHGINLRKSPCVQYLYYLAQIGLCMSPLSNNSLFLDYHRNPFPQFFARGLSVSLSTDDPLQIHLTKEPLVEEYSVAAQVWKLSSADLCEVARNGVLHSGFPHACKKHWVAADYWRPGPEGNDIQKTNVPNLRMRFRYDTYLDELRLIVNGAVAHNGRRQAQAAREAS